MLPMSQLYQLEKKNNQKPERFFRYQHINVHMKKNYLCEALG